MDNQIYYQIFDHGDPKYFNNIRQVDPNSHEYKYVSQYEDQEDELDQGGVILSDVLEKILIETAVKAFKDSYYSNRIRLQIIAFHEEKVVTFPGEEVEDIFDEKEDGLLIMDFAKSLEIRFKFRDLDGKWKEFDRHIIEDADDFDEEEVKDYLRDDRRELAKTTGQEFPVISVETRIIITADDRLDPVWEQACWDFMGFVDTAELEGDD